MSTLARVPTKSAIPLTSRNRSDHEKRFFPRHDRFGQRIIRQLMGKIFSAGKEAQERSPLLGNMVADRASQHRIARFECVEHSSLRDGTCDFERDFLAHMGKIAEMVGQHNSNHVFWNCVSNFRLRAFMAGVPVRQVRSSKSMISATSASALRPTTLPEDRARSRSSYLQRRGKRRPGHRMCRSKSRTYPGGRPPWRRAAR